MSGLRPCCPESYSPNIEELLQLLHNPNARNLSENQKMHEQDHITETKKRFIADNFKNTELGLVRIAKNLGLQAMSASDIVRHCHKIILSTPIQAVENHGKNYYFYSQEFSAVLTINKSSLGIITAKQSG